MFSSLRTRLWLSYALLIAVLLIVVAVGLVWAVLQAPRLLYPELTYNMRLVSETVSDQVSQLSATPRKMASFLAEQASTRNLRLVVIDPNNKVEADTGSGGVEIPFARILRNDQLRPMTTGQIRMVRPRGGGGNWFYMLRHLDNGAVFLVMAPAPGLPFGVLFRDQFFSTFLISAAIALGLAFLLALLLGSWITAPLRRMIAASRAVSRGEYPAVPVEGPREVQELAQAMNEMSQRVQSSQQSQRDFVANVSHELKTPLTSIQGFAQAILDEAIQTPDALRQAAGVIYSESTRMHRLVLDLLSLARLEAGTADLQRAPVNLDLLLHSVVDKFTPQAQAAQVDLRTDWQTLCTFTGDGDRLAQVFTNLVDNAIKFTPSGGQVTLAAYQQGSDMLITVKDTGPGIAPEDQARIFERFYQVDKSRRGDTARGGATRGVGLGLAIARQIVLAHDGKIWVESGPGQGSCFVVKIPLARADDSTQMTKPKGKR